MTDIETINAYITEIKAVDHKKDESFYTLLAKGVALLNLSDMAIAEEFDVSRPTATRWRNGTNAPHPAMRKYVYAWLEQASAEFLRRKERTVRARATKAPTNFVAQVKD